MNPTDEITALRAQLAEANERANRARLAAFRDAVAAIHDKVQEQLERQDNYEKEHPGTIAPPSMLGREAGLTNAMAAVLRVACPDAADAEDAIETLAAVEGS